MNLSAEDVREILRLLDGAHVDELRLETERFTLTLRRSADGSWTQESQVLGAPDLVAPDQATAEAAGVEQPAARPPGDGNLREVRAPLPGTFYRAPRPGAAPFVEPGSQVDEDTVVGIVETMKLMNSVPAGVRGRVVEICLPDAAFAPKGTVLLRIEPQRP